MISYSFGFVFICVFSFSFLLHLFLIRDCRSLDLKCSPQANHEGLGNFRMKYLSLQPQRTAPSFLYWIPTCSYQSVRCQPAHLSLLDRPVSHSWNKGAHFFFPHIFLRQGLIMWPGWSWTCNPPASALWVLGLHCELPCLDVLRKFNKTLDIDPLVLHSMEIIVCKYWMLDMAEHLSIHVSTVQDALAILVFQQLQNHTI
jgi:hypothetical protein